MKKILCPTDFSPAANNAAEYAAQLSKKTGAELTLIHVLSLPVIYDDYTTVGALKAYEEKIAAEKKELQDYCDALNKEYKIQCRCDHEFYSVEAAMREKTEDTQQSDLVVMGTNGADTLYQFYFGSKSYRTAKSLHCPILIVPEDYKYRDIQYIIFASGYRQGDEFLLQQLKQFLSDFNPRLGILHVSERDTLVSQEVYHSFCNFVDDFLAYSQKIEFSRIINEDEAQSIVTFMNNTNADLLSLCMEQHSFLYRLFHKNLIKKLTSYADYPILIFHK